MVRLPLPARKQAPCELIKWTSAFLVGVWFLVECSKGEDLMYRGLYTEQISKAHVTIPQRVSSSGEYISHDLTSFDNDSQVNFNISINGRQHLLILQRFLRFLSPGIKIERRHRNANISYEPSVKARSCHFQGVIYGHENSKVALSTCNGLTGIVHTKDAKYYMEPAHHSVKTIGPGHQHLIYKRSAVISNQPRTKRKRKRKKETHDCGTKDPKRFTLLEWKRQLDKVQLQEKKHKNKHMINIPSVNQYELGKHKYKKSHKRNKRSISKEYWVETLVVADSTTVEFHQDGDIETYLLSIMNLVSSIYKDPSIGNLINIVVVKIILIDDPLAEPDLNVTVSAQHTLKSFCKWQKKQNPSDDEHPYHHDVAVLITRKKICSDRNTPCNTLGVSHIMGMCRADKMCNVNQDVGITLAHTIAHEIGHNFGMFHDLPKIGCEPTIGNVLHIMAASFKNEAVDIAWSRCSRREITTFLDKGFGKCLEDPPATDEYSYPELPPGAMYNEDYQCKLQFGEESTSCSEQNEEICLRLWCMHEGSCFTQLIPAASGTSCGKHKWCQNLKCVPIMDPPAPIDGGWGEWTSWSDCSRTCGAGVSIMERHCDHPIPAHGGRYCLGERRKYRICNTDHCPENTSSFRAQQCTKFNSKPYEGKLYKWLPHFEQSDPCRLFCSDVNETVIVPRGEFAADGTPCNVGTRDVCIAGICKKVGCDWVVDSKAQEDECGICQGDGTKCDKITGEYHKQSSTSGYREIVVIPPGAHNIRIREMNHSLNYISIGSARSKKFYLNGKRHVTLPGEYMVAGSAALYKREGQLEKIRIPGPIKEPIVVYILFRGKVYNPGVEYKYSMWKKGSTKQVKYTWSHGLWSQCSATCGGGVKHRKPSCQEIIVSSLGSLLKGTATTVVETMCDPSEKPAEEIKTCNDDACPTHWWTGPWQSCPVTCTEEDENPMRHRSVMCVDGQETALPDNFCDRSVKPIEYMKCKPLPLCYMT